MGLKSNYTRYILVGVVQNWIYFISGLYKVLTVPIFCGNKVLMLSSQLLHNSISAWLKTERCVPILNLD